MPFDAVSDKGMIDFFKKYDIIVTDQDLPSRYTISRTALDDVYEMMLKNVKEQIKESSPKHVSVTFDLWTDRYRRLNYITFTLHYLTADFELKSFTLNTKLAQGKKTGEMILEMLNKTVAEFGLCDKTLHVVTDAGSNVKRAIALGNLDGHLCLGHGLHNLVIVDGIKRVPEVDAVVTKCKKIVKSIRYRLPDLEIEVETEQRKFLQEIDSVGEDIEFDKNEPMVDEDLSSPTREDCSAETTVSFNNEFGEVRLCVDESVSLSETNKQKMRCQETLSLRTIVAATRFVSNAAIAEYLKWRSLDEFIERLARVMYDRADNCSHDHLRGIAPHYTRPPDLHGARHLPRALLHNDVNEEEEEDVDDTIQHSLG
ncbi:uncharacterized protein LOC134747422 [Cydia strobilella]|uniref:uncharacterized protein LOC134747422 n=1 Tax=Cydia strobilella TaxID=1100964 RepID=UPI0030048AE5